MIDHREAFLYVPSNLKRSPWEVVIGCALAYAIALGLVLLIASGMNL